MKPIVAVLRGGPSGQYTESLRTGAYVLKHLSEQYSGRDIFIDNTGIWHLDGFPVKPQKALEHVDLAWNALHGQYGEDGKMIRILESIGVPYVGSDSVASALSMNKKLSKKVMRDNKIPTPIYLIVESGDDLQKKSSEIFFNFHMPVVIKPVGSGGSQGVGIARSMRDIVPLLDTAFEIGNTVLVEAFVPGKDVTCIVVEGLRGDDQYVPIPIELQYSAKEDIFHRSLKEDISVLHKEILHYSDELKKKISDLARKVHQVFGLKHYSRTDMRVSPTGRVYVLEVNTTPVLHDNAATIQSLQSVGISPEMFIEHLISLAR